MRRFAEILAEIDLLERRLDLLREELAMLQARCEHEFVSDQLMKICRKCGVAENVHD
ncbi:hypothetical protein BSNK01_26910 [Bacillaceae bacterium]